MVDYSKWDNLDSGSDSDSSMSNANNSNKTLRKQAAANPAVSNQKQKENEKDAARSRSDDRSAGRVLEQVEILRRQGNALFEQEDLPAALAAYDAQLRLVEGRKDEDSLRAACAALLNQTSAFFRMRKFGDAEQRCTRLLDAIGGRDPGGDRALRRRALHFRGFSRLRQGRHEEASSDLREALSTGVGNLDEAKALLAEAEAASALATCRDPEAKGRELLLAGDSPEAAKHFREAAARARRRRLPGRDADYGATAALARNLRMEGIAVARAGDPSSAESLLRGGLRELQGGTDGKGGSGVSEEGEGMLLAALGGLLAQQGRNTEAAKHLREASALLDEAITAAGAGATSANKPTATVRGGNSAAASPSALKSALAGVLASLGMSLLLMENGRSADQGRVTLTDSTGSDHTGGGGGRGASAEDGAVGEDGRAQREREEAVSVLTRALDLFNAEAAASEARNAGGEEGGGSTAASQRQQHRAKILDALSEAHARASRWELARSAAEQSLTAWRSTGEKGETGAAGCLLSLGHIALQLHGVDAGIEEASARWEEAATFLDASAKPSEAAEVRMRVAGFYTKVARSDPSRFPPLEEKIAHHYSEAARLFARHRTESCAAAAKSTTATTTTVVSPDSDGVEIEGPGGILPHETGPLESLGPSRWELGQKEALAWEGYAGAVGDDHAAAATALRKAERLLDEASVSEKDEGWSLRRVGILQSLALALARGGDHGAAEDKLVAAIRELEGLESDRNKGGAGGVHKASLIDLHKFVAIARRAKGDMPGAKDALNKLAALGGGGGDGRHGGDDVESLNRMLGRNRILVD